MSLTQERPSQAPTPPAATASGPVDLGAIKTRQQATWTAGDYSVVGTTLQIVGESLCEAVDLRAGERVLDVAAGNGNATLAASRRFAEVVGLDYVPALLAHARERADAERLPVQLREGDAENLPFGDGSFDVALSSFGVMFTPDQERAARELLRVVRPGGRIGLASWTPESFIGELFRTIGKHVPPAPGLKSPALWGTGQRLVELFGAGAAVIRPQRREFVFRYRSPQHWLQVFRSYYGPVHKSFAALAAPAQEALAADLLDLLAKHNRSGDQTLVAGSEYLEAVITTAG
jgi:ubiquinone/menaquinone biosynthesis C-methylase UbiE